ncbi:hypothetical protein FRB96_007974 [Tulasnella sp. 330]|nr:hypothetical protein FRB96_007974 [Tulasnella sp. 330]
MADLSAEVLPPLANAIYNKVPGAIFNTSSSQWTIPCKHELNLTFVFGGQKIYIHPLDLSAPGSAIGNPELDPVNGVAMCYGLVMRDVYILQDYGDMIFGSSTDQVPPFIKMLSITDPVEAHDDFINVRIDNNPNAPLKGQIKPVEALARSRSDLSVSNGGRVTQRLWFHVVVCVVSALLLSLGIYVLVQRLRRRDPGRDPMDRDDIKRFLFGQGDRKYRSMGAAVPVGIDDENDRQRLDINMAEKGVGGEDVVPLTQAQYEDPFRDDAYKK